MGRNLRAVVSRSLLAGSLGTALLLSGTLFAGAASAAPIGVLDPSSLTFASTPQSSLAALAWQQLGLNGPVAMSPFHTPTATFSVPPSHSNNPGGSTPFVDPEWNRTMVPNTPPDSGPVAGVPEPGAALLFAAGFGLVALGARRRS